MSKGGLRRASTGGSDQTKAASGGSSTKAASGGGLSRSKSHRSRHGASTAKSRWMKAKKRMGGIMLAVNRQPAELIDTAVRQSAISNTCKSGLARGLRLVAAGGRGKAVVIWSFDRKCASRTASKKAKANGMIKVLFRLPTNQSWCSACCFSEGAAYFAFGLVSGDFKIVETESGTVFQHFKPTTLKGVVTDIAADRNGMDTSSASMSVHSSSAVASVSQKTALSALSNPHDTKTRFARVSQCVVLENRPDSARGSSYEMASQMASYNGNSVVYVLEQKAEGTKRWKCQVVVRDVISGAVLHSYALHDAQSAICLWASTTRVICAIRPTRIRSRDLQIHCHDLDAGMIWTRIRHGNGTGTKTAITACGLSEGGDLLAVSDNTHKISVYTCRDGRSCLAFEQGSHIQHLSFSPDGKSFVAAGLDKRDGGSQKGLVVMRAVMHDSSSSSKDSPNDTSSGETKSLNVWDHLESETNMWQSQHPGPVTDCAFAEEGAMLVAVDGGSEDDPSASSVKIYDAETGAKMRKLPVHGALLQVDCQRSSLDGDRLIVAVGQGGKVYLWSSSTFQPCSSRLDRHDNDHQHHCTVAAFSNCGRYMCTGDAEGQVILREFVPLESASKLKTPNSKMKKSLVSSESQGQEAPHSRVHQKCNIRSCPVIWNCPGSICGAYFINSVSSAKTDDACVLVFCYWDARRETFISKFKRVQAPLYPEHEWWGAAVQAAGGRTSVHMKSRCGVVVVENLKQGQLTLMNLTDTVPLPSEMPLQGIDCGRWLSSSPHLIHRQDRSRKGRTILHLLAEKGDISTLSSYLSSVRRIAPIRDEEGKTPLDVAMAQNDYPATKMLLHQYMEWDITGLIGLKHPLGRLAKQYPDLCTMFLRKAIRRVDCDLTRLPIKKSFVSHSPTLKTPWTGNEGTGHVMRPVDAFVVGFCGFMDADGPFESIVQNGDLAAFDTKALRKVIEFKWRAYGFPIYKFMSGLHFANTVLFSVGQIQTALWPDWREVQITAERPGYVWLAVHCIVCILTLPMLYTEASEAWHTGLRDYLREPFNYLEIVNSLGLMTPVPYYYIRRVSLDPIATSIIILMTWMRVLTYLRAYNWSGSLIRMITAILYKMSVFFVILMLLFAGYTCAFSVLFPFRLEFRGARGRLFVNFFEAMLGNPMMYGLYNDDLSGKDLNETVLQEYLAADAQLGYEAWRVMFGQLLLTIW